MSDSAGGAPEGGGEQSANVREQDRFLPIANISRIMKTVLPSNGKIAKDAKETVQECVSEFISFVTIEANDRCQKENRKTITGDDLLWAMAALGVEDYIDPLRIYLQKFKEDNNKGSAKKGSTSATHGGSQSGNKMQMSQKGS